LAFSLKQSRTWLHTWPEHCVDPQITSAFNQLINKRQHGQPIAYLTGQREFWSHTFQVSNDVLIPRPDTELLVECCLKLITANKPQAILELGTGSGAIAVSIAAECPQVNITATDISRPALDIARLNADNANTPNIQWIESNWFSNIHQQHYDLIVSNPPYIELNDVHLQQGDVRYEPRLALISGADGLHDIRIIAKQARSFLTKNGYLALEHGYNQTDAVTQILNQYNYSNINNFQDLQGNPRVTIAQYSF
jgi:release factor glutamine methyltransferase